MAGYILQRLLAAIPTLLGVALITFLLMRAVPGDVVTSLVGLEANVSPERMAELRRLFGLDLPLHVQFGQWLGAVLQGDFGSSLRTGREVAQDLALRFPVTLQLTLMGLFTALLIAVPLGVLAALRRGGFVDYLASFLAILGLSVPGFFLALLLILLFALGLGWLPPAGFVPLAENPAQNLRHMVLPALSLGLILAGAVTRILRSSMLEVLSRDYIRTARAKGLSERVVIFRHALRNALIPVVTVIGIQFGSLLGGAVIIEQVFSLPGVGRFALEGINLRDYPVVQGTVLFVAAAAVLVNLLVDLLYSLIDPRIRYE
ncbi:MAG: ABC transporter permease subunit [Deinococcus-Thermus bacterium]|jgi:peptide/nickel transport system permease protein|nr:nickel ABC transporter permease [Meiothermus luteus]RMH58047.1 MAG: ABC transporter permease subunit [Deinococcota bacterium]